MEFLNPSALYALALLPLAVVPYLIRRRPRRLFFSSLLFIAESSRSASRPWWGLPRLPLIFFLQLLFFLLLILALAKPVLSLRPAHVAIIVDNSASMQAREGGKSRFELAKDEARSLMNSLSLTTRFTLFHTAPTLEVVGTSLSRSEAVGRLERLAAYDLGEEENLPVRLSRLVEDGRYQRLVFITDRPAAEDAAAFRVITVGKPQGNLALTSLTVRRPLLTAAHLEAEAAVTNFSSAKRAVRVVLKGVGRPPAIEERTVDPRKSVTVAFKGLAEAPYYEAQIEGDDGFAVDNRRAALLPGKTLSIVAVTPRPQALRTLGAIPGVSLRTLAPKAYLPQEPQESAEPGLLIFHYAAPLRLPRSHALFVLPPRENPLARPGEPLSAPVVSSWREPHALTRYINFALLRPTYARPLRPRLAAQAVVESSEGALVLAFEHHGFRYLVLGFDPFPYLGKENLPMSILTLNLLAWFQEGMKSPDLATGEPLRLAPPQNLSAIVTTPGGERREITASSGFFNETFFSGLYRVQTGRSEELVAVNFHNLDESDLADPRPVAVRAPSRGGQADAALVVPFWPPLLGVALLLLLLEWFFHVRARRAHSVQASAASLRR